MTYNSSNPSLTDEFRHCNTTISGAARTPSGIDVIVEGNKDPFCVGNNFLAAYDAHEPQDLIGKPVTVFYKGDHLWALLPKIPPYY